VSSSFIQTFGFDSEGEPPEEREQPAWHGPPEDELGVATPLNVVVGRSEHAVVALTEASSFTSGVTLSFVAQARDLDRRIARTLFHDQHPFGPGEDDLSDGFLRLGVELPGGTKASNIRGPRLFSEDDPAGPVFIQRGGRGGSGRHNRVVMHPDYWVWPLPEPGTIRVSCEWPLVGIALSSAEVDGAVLVEAAARALPLWPA
jgi:hypothetical protein